MDPHVSPSSAQATGREMVCSSRFPSCPHYMIPPQGFLLTSLVYISNVIVFFRKFFLAIRLSLSSDSNRSLAPSINNMAGGQSKPIKSQIQLHHPRQKRTFHCSPEPCVMTLIPNFVVHRHNSRSKFEDLLTQCREPACQCRPPLCFCAAAGPFGNGTHPKSMAEIVV